MKSTIKTAVGVIFIIASHGEVNAQSIKHDSTRQLKNTVRFNLTGMILFSGGYFVLGYERVVKPNQSFTINFGIAKLPRLTSVSTDSFKVSHDVLNKGYNVSADYRFYLKSLNVFNAPRGVYIGPYYSFNYFHRQNSWDLISGTTQVNTDTKFTIHTAGIELGYQFVLWKHFAIDLVMLGPGIGFYGFDSIIDSNTTLDAAQKQQLLEATQQVISQKYPGLNLVLNGKEVNGNGHFRTTTVGFRYLIQLGYRF